MNLDQLTNEELDVLTATEIMGWHKESLFLGLEECWTDAEGISWWITSEWEPTVNGNEHQAMMVVKKLDSPSCQMQMSFYGGVADVVFANPIIGRVLGWCRSSFGRAIILAALKAREVPDA